MTTSRFASLIGIEPGDKIQLTSTPGGIHLEFVAADYNALSFVGPGLRNGL